MIRTINFIIPNSETSPYSRIIHALIDPIRLYLPDSIISRKAIPDGVNVHFFLEYGYRKRIDIFQGTSIFMSHGIADKGWRDGPAVKDFDYVCVSGPLWVQKMIDEGIEAGKILMIGYPKLDPLFQNKKISTETNSLKTILYAPTHHNSKPSSYPAFLKFLDYFPDEFRILSSPHPFHKSNKQPTLQELVEADVVISDSGSLLYEAWALDKPVVFPDWLVKTAVLEHWPQTFAALIYRDNIGYHANNFIHLVHLIYKALDDGMGEREGNFIDGIFPPALRGCSGRITAETLLKIAQL